MLSPTKATTSSGGSPAGVVPRATASNRGFLSLGLASGLHSNASWASPCARKTASVSGHSAAERFVTIAILPPSARTRERNAEAPGSGIASRRAHQAVQLAESKGWPARARSSW